MTQVIGTAVAWSGVVGLAACGPVETGVATAVWANTDDGYLGVEVDFRRSQRTNLSLLSSGSSTVFTPV